MGAPQRGPCSLLARHLAFHALHIKIEAIQESIVGHLARGEHFLARIVPDGARPDGQATVFEPSTGLGHALLQLGGHIGSDFFQVDGPSFTPHQCAPLSQRPSSRFCTTWV